MDEKASFTPPYGIAWRTFLNSLDHMAELPMPNRIDRSFLTWLPGLQQSYFMSALRSFGLADSDNAPAEQLVALVQRPMDRPEIVRGLVKEHYSRPLALADENATTGTLMETWKEEYGQEGETRRKATTFFLHAAKYAQLTLSPHWESGVRASSRGASTSKARRKAGKPKQPVAPEEPSSAASPPAQGDSYRVDLLSGAGDVELKVNVDLFKISKADRAFVLKLVDALRDYAEEDVIVTQVDTVSADGQSDELAQA